MSEMLFSHLQQKFHLNEEVKMKNIRKISTVFTTMFAFICTQPARADITCALDVYQIALTPDGWVSASFTSSSIYRIWWICPVSGSTVVNDGYSSARTISSEACRSIYTQLLTIKASGKAASFAYNGLADCSGASLPADGFPSLFPFFIAFK